jgi:hypothetical protein
MRYSVLVKGGFSGTFEAMKELADVGTYNKTWPVNLATQDIINANTNAVPD